MHEPNERRRNRMSSLHTNLKEIDVVRADLLRKVGELDAQSEAIQREYNSLYNLDAPSASIPDEILSAIFEAGTLIEQIEHPQFGIIVSHVTQRWRDVALSTPRLWTKIRCSPSDRWDDKIASYFHRSKAVPIDLMIDDGGRISRILDSSLQSSQLISDHFRRCRRLFIRSMDQEYLLRMLQWASSQSTSILEAIDLRIRFLKSDVELPSRGVHFLSLKSVSIAGFGINPHALRFFRPLFESLTSLHLAGLKITDMPSYIILRDILTAVQSLTHLELGIDSIIKLPSTDFPIIVLPALQILLIDTNNRFYIFHIVSTLIHATSLHTMSLSGWEMYESVIGLDSMATIIPSRFPMVRNLKLVNYDRGATNLTEITDAFPGVVHLTYYLDDRNIDHVLDVLADLRWSNLQTIALSGDAGELRSMTTSRMREVLLRRNSEGYPIRALRLPLGIILTKNMARLQGCVEIEEYVDDWPTSFPSW